MQHQYWTAAECNCDKSYCNICVGGLAICKACGLYEGGLTTECPGVRSVYKSDLVYEGVIDFKDGRWQKGVTVHMSHAYSQPQPSKF